MTSYPESVNTNARVRVLNNGSLVGSRRAINFVNATSITDDGTNEKVTVTLPTGGTSTDRLSASADVATTVANGGGDINWSLAGVSVTDNVGSSFDLLGTSINNSKPTLEVLHDGLYAITAQFNCSNPQDATSVSYTLFSSADAAFSPSTDDNTNPHIQDGANLSMTYWLAAGTPITFYVANNATSPIDAVASFTAQRIA